MMKLAEIDNELVVKIKSHFNVTNKEKAWLKAVWGYMKNNFSYPEYRKIRASTVLKTSTAFNPRSIDSLLVTINRDLYIRFLGLMIINPSDEVFKNGLRLILEVKQQMFDDADKTEFSLLELAEKLKIDIHKLNLSFKIFSDFFSMWSSSGSNNSNLKLIQTDNFTVTSESAQDFYLSFTNLNQSIWDKFQNLTQDHSVILPLKMQHYLSHTNSFIDQSRLQELKQINNPDFDLTKLIQLTKEIEWSFANENYYATALL